jgi:hypothetical protein
MDLVISTDMLVAAPFSPDADAESRLEGAGYESLRHGGDGRQPRVVLAQRARRPTTAGLPPSAAASSAWPAL